MSQQSFSARLLNWESSGFCHDAVSDACAGEGPYDLGEMPSARFACDPDEDVANIIPMPGTISSSLRARIKQALTQQVEFAAGMDPWLHTAQVALGGASPFEYIVQAKHLEALLTLLESQDVVLDACESKLQREKVTRSCV